MPTPRTTPATRHTAKQTAATDHTEASAAPPAPPRAGKVRDAASAVRGGRKAKPTAKPEAATAIAEPAATEVATAAIVAPAPADTPPATPTPATRKGKARADAPTNPRRQTKQATLIEMLQQREGATIAELAAATGWQHHSVRGAMSYALKKQLGLDVTSEVTKERGRVYRIPTMVTSKRR
jgi:Protein of unknown function (DUF3489)